MNTQANPILFDAIIVGAGPVGISTALLLSQQGVRCALLEKNTLREKPTKPTQQTNSFDGRTLALNLESSRLLNSINCLPSSDSTQAIKTIRVSQQGHFGSCLLESERENLSHFGITVNSIDLGKKMQESLFAECAKGENLSLFDGIDFEHIELSDNYSVVTIPIKKDEQSITLQGKILIAADGTQSQVRQYFDFPVTVKDYQQIATLTKITHQNHHQNIAHERFLNNGILAFLPTHLSNPKSSTKETNGYVSSAVWLQTQADTLKNEQLSEEQLTTTLEKLFGKQYGEFISLSPRSNYAMKEVVATQTQKHNVLLIGNAAHSLHPVAGQGLNLGLQDAQNIAQQIALSDCTVESLQRFAHTQQKSLENIRRFVNDLLDRFSSPSKLATLQRTLLMIGFEKATPLRRPFLHHLSGVQTTPPWFWKTLKSLHSLREKSAL
jgi:2-octaprenyl-6-methoxyphenol hydroxylase